jgi:uncharacterized protein with GYD domain
MATFVQLINWTDQGVRTFRDTLDREKAFRDLIERLGGSLKDAYWTIGPYDIVAVVEAPDDETMTAIALQTASWGNIRTTTLRGFNRDEVARIIEKTG